MYRGVYNEWPACACVSVLLCVAHVHGCVRACVCVMCGGVCIGPVCMHGCVYIGLWPVYSRPLNV